MSERNMSQLATHRYTITVPENLAKQIEQVCVQEGRNRSELFREAFRCYLNSTSTPRATSVAARQKDAYQLFWPEWSTEKDSAHDRLAIKNEKDRLLEQWAHMVETEPGFEDLRGVTDEVNVVAGELIV